MSAISRRTFLATSAAAGLFFEHGHWCFAHHRSPADGNPFLQGNFGPVHEEINAEHLPVLGKIPPGLDGMFVRNGPNPQFPPKNNYHWFEGDGMVHGVRVRDGVASYRNRWVRTAAWREEHAAGKTLYDSILDPPDLKLMGRQILAGKMPYPNRANTALVWHHGKLMALWEGGPPHELRLPDLDTQGVYTFNSNLKHAFTAHPKIDPITGDLVFLGYSPYPPFLQYSVADRTGAIVHTTPVPLPRPVMMHDLAITENYAVFIDTPGIIDLSAILTGKPMFRWEPELGARIGILPRRAAGEDVRWFEIDPCFIFHVFNAHENGDEVVLEACRFPEYPAFVDLNKSIDADNVESLIQVNPPIAYRWRLNLKTGGVAESAMDDRSCEFPRINDRLAGRDAKYGYAVGGTQHTSSFIKYDFERTSSWKHDFGPGRLTGEGVFVEREGATAADDGYLVSFVYDEAEQRSEFVIVDARDFDQPPLARVMLPQRVPYGFHGLWLDDQA